MGDMGYVVAKVNRVLLQATPEPQINAQRHQQYVQWWSEAEGLAYYETLKQRYKAQIKVPRPAPGSAEK